MHRRQGIESTCSIVYTWTLRRINVIGTNRLVGVYEGVWGYITMYNQGSKHCVRLVVMIAGRLERLILSGGTAAENDGQHDVCQRSNRSLGYPKVPSSRTSI